MLRVAVSGTGDVGHYGLRGILTHPRLELVGVRVWSEDKAGLDAGELIGWDHVGVTTTTSTEQLIDLAPDAVFHTAPSRVLDPVPELLAARINVVTLGDAGLIHPPSWRHERKAEIETACAEGASSLFYGGIDAGWASHTLPIVLSGICERIDLLTVYEVRDYDPLPLHQLDWFNFGKPSGDGARFASPGGIRHAWEPPLRLIAQALGAELDEVEEFFEWRLAPEDFAVPAMTIRRGTVAAVRFGLRGMVGGVERLRVEHVNRLRRDLAPEWMVQQGYGVTVEGQPRYRLHLDLEDPAGIQQRPALWGTAMYGVNAIPHVVAAAPGIRTVLDLPHIAGAALGGRHQDDNWTLSKRILARPRRG